MPETPKPASASGGPAEAPESPVEPSLGSIEVLGGLDRIESPNGLSGRLSWEPSKAAGAAAERGGKKKEPIGSAASSSKQSSGGSGASSSKNGSGGSASSERAPALAVNNLSCSIDGVQILYDVSITVFKGDFVSILGPNGAGKSTFLKCLLRLHDRAVIGGAIEIEGQDISKYGQKALARVISYVPQAGGWIPPFSVIDFARLSRFPYASAVSGMTKADERAVEKALELTGLEKLSKRLLKTLSGGERQKAYLAAALAQETPIMLLDEPAASLDPRHAAELSELLSKLSAERDLTMLMITHDLNHPLRAGGLALVLKEGRRLYFGPVEGLEGEVLERAFDHDFLYLDHPSGQGRVIISQ